MENFNHPTVPPSPPPIHGTAGHPRKAGTTGGTKRETTSLKALARNVLQRDKERDSKRDNCPKPKNQHGTALAALTPDQIDDYEERAAIMEHDGGLSREYKHQKEL